MDAADAGGRTDGRGVREREQSHPRPRKEPMPYPRLAAIATDGRGCRPVGALFLFHLFSLVLPPSDLPPSSVPPPLIIDCRRRRRIAAPAVCIIVPYHYAPTAIDLSTQQWWSSAAAWISHSGGGTKSVLCDLPSFMYLSLPSISYWESFGLFVNTIVRNFRGQFQNSKQGHKKISIT